MSYTVLFFRLYSRVIAETKKLNKQDQSMCYHFNLNDDQLKACLVDPNVLLLVGKGTNDGLAHCERQFVHERWNCSNNNFSNKLFKRSMYLRWIPLHLKQATFGRLLRIIFK